MPRAFNGTTDRITLGPGAVVAGPISVMAIVRTTASAFQEVFTVDPFGPNEFLIANTRALVWAPAAGAVTSTLIAPLSVWALVGFTKATGTSTVSFYLYNYSTRALTTDTPAGTTGNTTGPSSLTIGERSDGANPFSGDIAVVAEWSRVLSAAEVAQLPPALQGWRAATPTGLWVLNQASVSDAVVDAFGTANQTAISGTTVSAQDVPGFDYGYIVDRPSRMPLGV